MRRAHACGAVTVMDCAQTAAHVSLRLDALGVDFAAFSGHKMYGPLGIGVLFARAGMLDALSPFLYGGEMVDQVERGRTTFQEGPRRFEAARPTRRRRGLGGRPSGIWPARAKTRWRRPSAV